MSKGAQIAVGACGVALLLGWYGATNLGAESTFQYYKTVDEFQTMASHLGGRSLRVHGYVSLDSIQRDLAAKRVHFSVQNDPPHAGGEIGRPLPVIFLGLDTPDLFKDGAEVVVEGRIENHGDKRVFLADNVLAKCPSKFEAKIEAEPPGSTPL